MISDRHSGKPQLKDKSVRWMMRVVGFSLAGASVVLLSRDLTSRKSLEWLCGAGSLIGAATFASSWAPGRKKSPDQEEVNLFV